MSKVNPHDCCIYTILKIDTPLWASLSWSLNLFFQASDIIISTFMLKLISLLCTAISILGSSGEKSDMSRNSSGPKHVFGQSPTPEVLQQRRSMGRSELRPLASLREVINSAFFSLLNTFTTVNAVYRDSSLYVRGLSVGLSKQITLYPLLSPFPLHHFSSQTSHLPPLRNLNPKGWDSYTVFCSTLTHQDLRHLMVLWDMQMPCCAKLTQLSMLQAPWPAVEPSDFLSEKSLWMFMWVYRAQSSFLPIITWNLTRMCFTESQCQL